MDNQRAHEPDRVDCTHRGKAPRTAATVSLLLFQGFISVKVAQKMCHPGIGSIRHSVPRASLLNPSQASPVLESFIDASYGPMVWALSGYISFRVPLFSETPGSQLSSEDQGRYIPPKAAEKLRDSAHVGSSGSCDRDIGVVKICEVPGYFVIFSCSCANSSAFFGPPLPGTSSYMCLQTRRLLSLPRFGQTCLKMPASM